MFSANSPLGACPECEGFGRSIQPDPERIIPDRGRTLAERPIDPWNKPSYKEAYDDLREAGKKIGLKWNVPWAELPEEHRRLVEEGGEGFYGIRGFFEWLESRRYKTHVRILLARYRSYRTCKDCEGSRLKPEALAVRIGRRSIADFCSMSIGDLSRALARLKLATTLQQVRSRGVRSLLKRKRDS